MYKYKYKMCSLCVLLYLYCCTCTGLHVHCATVHCTAARENWVDFKGIIQKRI